MDTFKRLLTYLRPYRALFILCLGLVGVISALELLKPWPIKLVVDQIIADNPLEVGGYVLDPNSYSLAFKLGWVIVLFLATHFLAGFVQLLNNYLSIRIGQKMVQDLRCDLFAHLQRQSLLFHQKQPTGDLIYRLMGDTYAVQTLLMNGVFTTLTSIAILAGMLVVCLNVDAVLTLYSLGVIPFLFLAIKKISRHNAELTTEVHMREGAAYSTAQRILSSISLIQAFAREDDEFKEFATESRVSFDRKLSLYSFQTAYGWIVNGIIVSGTAAVLFVGVQHVLSSRLSVGELLVFLAYLNSLYTPLDDLSTTVAGIGGSLARARRVLEIMDVDEAVAESPDAKPIVITEGAVRFEGVSFGYDPARPVLSGIDFSCPAGSLVAVTGQTGAGKTSLVSLLLRLFDPQAGRILIDGQDIKHVTLSSLRRHIAIVPQETQLFPMTIRDNIAYGRKQATRDEVIAAARTAGAHDFISALPGGYDTVLAQCGGDLSGGQRQRLAIARALIKDAPILIFDEPTSALDPETEEQIMAGLSRLTAGRTTFIITHRPAVLRRADLILHIEDGGVAATGSAEGLTGSGGGTAPVCGSHQGIRMDCK